MSPGRGRGPSFIPGGPVVAKSAFREELKALRMLAPYLWPRESRELRVRVLLAIVCLIGAKLINIVVPLIYKQAVDALGSKNAVIVVPVAMVIAYGVARVASQAFGE